MTEDNSKNRTQGEFGLRVRGQKKDYKEYYPKIQMRSNSTVFLLLSHAKLISASSLHLEQTHK